MEKEAPEATRMRVSSIVCSLDLFYENNRKLVLRPLSMLTEEIEFEGERFVPIIKLSEDFIAPEYRDSIKILEFDRVNYWLVGRQTQDTQGRKIDSTYQFKKNISRLEFWQVQKLVEWHFDVFDLISSGHAISWKEVYK